MMSKYLSYKDALERGLVVEGAKVVCYPDHKGDSLVGVVESVFDKEHLIFKILDGDLMTVNYGTGKWGTWCDTSIDINLVEIE